MAMFENIGVFFKRFMQNEKKELLAENSVAQSKDTAKDRLHIVLMQDRAKVSADFLEMMKEEIIEVIKKYIVVDESKIDVRLTNEENEDGSIGVPVLLANIPILNIRNDLKSEYMTHTIEDFNNYEDNNDKTQVIQLIKETSPEVNHEITHIELPKEKNIIKDNEILENDLSKQLKYETKEEIDKVEKGILRDDKALNIEKTEINMENELQIEFINENENSLVEEIKLEDVDNEDTNVIINEEKEIENKEVINNSIENKKYEINYEEKVNDIEKYNKEKLENKGSGNNKEQKINDNDKNELESKISENNKEQKINDKDKNELENKISENNEEQKISDNDKNELKNKISENNKEQEINSKNELENKVSQNNKEYKTNDKEYYKFEKEKQKSKLELTIDELDDEYDDDDDDDVTFDDLLKAAEEEEERLKQLNIQNVEENEKKLNKVKSENKNLKKKKKASKNRKK